MGSCKTGADFCSRRRLARMTVLPAGPKGSSFEFIADRPSAPGARVLAGQAQGGSRSGKARANPAEQGSVLRTVGYSLLSRRKMTFAADPQVDQPYPLGELSYAIVIPETLDWNRMPRTEEVSSSAAAPRLPAGAYFCLSALA
jgi:hypothetical protein